MPKSFLEAFEDWKKDDRYKIGEDIGCEQTENLEYRPTTGHSSSTTDENEHTHST